MATVYWVLLEYNLSKYVTLDVGNLYIVKVLVTIYPISVFNDICVRTPTHILHKHLKSNIPHEERL